MNKLLRKFYDLSERLQSFGADKYLHVLACLLIAQTAGAIARIWADNLPAALVGLEAALVVGLAKELLDYSVKHEHLDGKDLVADCIGGALGALFVMLP